MLEAVREVTVGVKEVESCDEEGEPVTHHFKPVDYNQQAASPSNIPSRMHRHDPACFHPLEEDEDEDEDYFSMRHEIVRPRLVPRTTHAHSDTPVKSTSTTIPVPAARADSDPTRCDSAVDSAIDSVLAPDLTSTHFDIYGLKRYTDAELEREDHSDAELAKESKKDSGAGFEIEGEGARWSEEAKPLEMPVPQSLDLLDLQLLAEKVVDGYFDF